MYCGNAYFFDNDLGITGIEISVREKGSIVIGSCYLLEHNLINHPFRRLYTT